MIFHHLRQKPSFAFRSGRFGKATAALLDPVSEAKDGAPARNRINPTLARVFDLVGNWIGNRPVSHPGLERDVLEPIANARNGAAIFLDMLFTNEPRRNPAPGAVGDADAKHVFGLEYSGAVVSQGAVLRQRVMRLGRIKP